uniref:Odorant receptor n=1 Tax=Colaphellus bowringi TaxID=561076 RepID=A0A0S3J465_9CUCU|nr:odorant receptor OR31 [Colaphellus bowringi]
MMAFGYPKNFFHMNEATVRFLGVWLPSKKHHILIRLLHPFYFIFVYSTLIYFVIGQYMKVEMKNVTTIISSLAVLLTTHAGHVKGSLVVFGGRRIQEIKDILQDVNYQYYPVGEVNPGSTFQKEKTFYTMLSYALLVGFMMPGASGTVTTASRLMIEMKGNNTFESIDKNCNDFITYTFYVPIFIETKWECIISSSLMYSGMTMYEGIAHAAHDGLLAGLLICLKTQLLILGDIFRTLRQRVLSRLNIPEDYSVIHDEENPALEEEMYRQLCLCTEHLKILLTARDKIEKTFTYMLLMQTIASFPVFASSLYAASQTPLSSTDFYTNIDFFGCVLVQLAMFCWFGNGITEAGEAIRSALYEGDWYSCSPRFKKSMILTMTRMQRPVYLSIGRFSPLTITTLVSVCQGSFSYFTLFKSL